MVLDATGRIAPTHESMSLGIDPYVTANPAFGLGAAKTMVADYIDANPHARILHVPGAYSGSGLDTNWAVPSGPQTVNFIARLQLAVALTGCRNVALYWYQGENPGTPPSDWGTKTTALWDYIQAQLGFTFAVIVYARLCATPPDGCTGDCASQWADVRTAQAAVASSKRVMVDPPDPALVDGHLHLSTNQQRALGLTASAALLAKWSA